MKNIQYEMGDNWYTPKYGKHLGCVSVVLKGIIFNFYFWDSIWTERLNPLKIKGVSNQKSALGNACIFFECKRKPPPYGALENGVYAKSQCIDADFLIELYPFFLRFLRFWMENRMPKWYYIVTKGTKIFHSILYFFLKI